EPQTVVTRTARRACILPTGKPVARTPRKPLYLRVVCDHNHQNFVRTLTRNDSEVAAKPLRIAIADDHVLTRELFFSMISQGDRRCQLVAEASTAAETLSICRRFSPDLLLLDVDLAGKGAVALVPEIKRVTPATRVLLYCTTA